jgi:hypothetical protein
MERISDRKELMLPHYVPSRCRGNLRVQLNSCSTLELKGQVGFATP